MLILNIKHAPICHPNNQRKYGVTVGETVRISCTVIANPHVERFRWWITEMGKRREIPRHLFTSRRSYSILNFTRSSTMSYGTLSCAGENKVGFQKQPCMFTLSSARRPDKPKDCEVYNGSSGFVELRCKASYNGGLKQWFTVEVYDIGRNSLMFNLTNRMKPHFVLRDLKRWNHYRLEVYSTNRKGDSNRIEFANVNMPSILSKSTNSSDIDTHVEDTEFNSVYLVVAIVGFFILAFILVALIMAIRNQQKWR